MTKLQKLKATSNDLVKNCNCGCMYKEDECPNCNKVTDLIPYSRITRVEVIGTHGRELVKHDVTDVQISIQDDGQTLKLFLKDKQNV
tara:strand:- start:22 stop:282 length:261 start_codon:yes stop_codon:yes gene_type:complete